MDVPTPPRPVFLMNNSNSNSSTIYVARDSPKLRGMIPPPPPPYKPSQQQQRPVPLPALPIVLRANEDHTTFFQSRGDYNYTLKALFHPELFEWAFFPALLQSAILFASKSSPFYVALPHSPRD